MTRTALVIGCGGTIGGAWTIAALHHLVDQTGWDPASASILQGTSAGAEIVTMLAGAHSVADLVAMQQGNPPNSVLCSHLADCPSSLPKLPAPVLPSLSALRAGGPGHSRLTGVAPRGRGDTAWLQRLADASTGGREWFERDGVRLVAYRPEDGERVAFGAPGSPAATAGQGLRASWAIPGWMPPVEIDGRTYVDGGAASTASVDLVGPDDADLIYLLAPMASAGAVSGPGVGGALERFLLRKPMSTVMWREVETVRARGTEVVVITPDARDLRGLGPNFMARDKRAEAFEQSMISAADSVRRALDEGAVA
jgi:NTE family protein